MKTESQRPKILYHSGELHTAIKGFLASPSDDETRGALVAYIAGSGDAFLPHPQNLQIVCSLEAGATNPETLIRLIKKGASVNQSDRLHMKVYCSSRKGAVICSANASSNALGKGALKEAGVWFPPGLVDIKKFLKYADPRPVTNHDLRELARGADLKATGYSGRTRNATAITSLAEWLDSTASKPWKVGWWNSPTAIPAKAAKAQSYAHYGIKQLIIFSRAERALTSRAIGFSHSG